MSRVFPATIVIVLLLTITGSSVAEEVAVVRYQVDPGTPASSFRILPLDSTGSTNLVEVAEHPIGTPTRLTRFQLGVAMNAAVLAATVGDDVLYVDTNRDGRWSSDERFTDDWSVELPIQQTNGRTLNQSFQFQIDGSKTTLEIAQRGAMVGRANLNGRDVSARVVDENVNGVFSDPDDRLLLDLNNDGKFSPLRERFACSGVVRISHQRYTLAFSENETRLELTPLASVGYVIPKVNLTNTEAAVTDFRVQLVSESGIHISTGRVNSKIEVPVGQYRVQLVQLEMKDARVWSMEFKRHSRLKPGEGSVIIKKDEVVEFDVLGSLRLQASAIGGSLATKSVSIQPKLKSATGLILTDSRVGRLSAQNENRLTATFLDTSPTGVEKLLAHGGAGFQCGEFCPITFSNQPEHASTSRIKLGFNSGPLAGTITRTVAPPGTTLVPTVPTIFELGK